jgi:hypothetical protein
MQAKTKGWCVWFCSPSLSFTWTAVGYCAVRRGSTVHSCARSHQMMLGLCSALGFWPGFSAEPVRTF